MRSVLRRPLLVLSAVATIAVPGVLAVFAVLGYVHKDSSLGSGLSQGSRQEASLPATTGPPASGTTVGGTARPGPDARTAIPPGPSAGDQTRGLRLLRQAAAAGRTASYQGVESIHDTTLAGPSSTVAAVWHRGGGLTVTQVAGGQPEKASDGDGRAPEGVFGVTAALVGLLGKNYEPAYLGTSSLDGRPALVVGVRRPSGSTAARFWLDERTLVPLRRDVYDTSGNLVSDDRFTRVRFDTTGLPKTASAGSMPETWTAASPARLLSQLSAEGCRLPPALPGGLSLYTAARAATSAGPVTDFGFSDGLSMVSLFAERGTLPASMPGWQRERVSGHAVYVAQHEVTMSGGGFVYTLVTDAPPRTVDAVVGALPANGGPGFLTRLGRGMSRLMSDLDPFG